MVRRTRRIRYSDSSDDSTERLIRLWLLRLLVPLAAHREFIGPNGMNSDPLAEAIGLAHWIDPGSPDFDASLVRAELRQLHARAESEDREWCVPPALAANRTRLAALVGLSETDCRILEFVVLIHTDRLLDDTADWLGQLSSPKVCHVLSVLLDLPEADLRPTLSTRGLLAQSGLVSLERHRATDTLRSRLNVLSASFADRMLTAEEDPVALLRDTVSLSQPAELSIEDFGHVTESLSVLRPYLRHTLEARRRGVNVFIHGEPGTGKSQLAKVLARDLGCELFAVASQDEDGDAVQGEQRLRAFRAAQSFFAQRRALILFDETEDVFDDGNRFFGKKSTAQTRKAWINRMLEKNPVPTLWLSNSVGCLDPAFVRRFDLVMELPVPPKTQRERIVHDACGDMLSTASLCRIAAAESLAPAVIARAASVVKAIRADLPADSVSSAIEHLVGNTLIAQGHGPLQRSEASRLPEHYDPRYINADADLSAVAEGLCRARSGRLCLYGPPGTGKTAFGRWLSERLDVPLAVRRASDIISPFLG
ncbi:MAG: AAA family ATPase, partial [Gammaproteobacteria bacterium]